MNIESILLLLILEIVRYGVDLVLNNAPCLICYEVVSCGSSISSGHKVELSSTFGNMLLQLVTLKFVVRQVDCGGGNTAAKLYNLQSNNFA